MTALAASASANIILVDDHPLVRDGLRLRLEGVPGLVVAGEAGNAEEALMLAQTLSPDLALMDVGMSGMSGIALAGIFHERFPAVRVLMLSMHDNEHYFFEALEAGASGYVLKTAADRDVVDACRAAMRGEPFLYPAAVTALIRDYLERAQSGEATPKDPLSPRELEVVKLIAEGHTSEEIAGKLFISKKTVDRHRANVLEKLGMRNRVELTRYAIRRGLVEP
jgi:DNA-binding NarL/FixJ family response regulator